MFTHYIICISNFTAPQNGHPRVNDTMPKPGSSSCARTGCWKPQFCGVPDFGGNGARWSKENRVSNRKKNDRDQTCSLKIQAATGILEVDGFLEELHPSAE